MPRFRDHVLRSVNRRVWRLALAIGVIAAAPGPSSAFGQGTAGERHAAGNRSEALPAAAFLDSLGINTHIGATSYKDPVAVAQKLRFIGLQHVRDGLGYGLADARRIHELSGAKFDLVYAEYTKIAGAKFLADAVRYSEAGRSFIEAFEGPNEPDYFGIHYDALTGADAIIATQKRLFSLVRNNPVLKDVPVFCASFSFPAGNSLTIATGDLSAHCDFAVLHAYPQNLSLGRYLPFEYLEKWKYFPTAITAPGRPLIITEGGWSSAANNPEGVDEMTQAKYLLAYLLDAFRLGISRTYLYELVDDAEDASLTNIQNAFGLFRADGTPKPAARMLAKVNALLRGGKAKPASLAYVVQNMPRHGHDLLLAKDDGTFVLCLWKEEELWDGAAHKPAPTTATSVTVQFDAVKDLRIVDPLSNTPPGVSRAAGNAWDITLPDHPIFVLVN